MRASAATELKVWASGFRAGLTKGSEELAFSRAEANRKATAHGNCYRAVRNTQWPMCILGNEGTWEGQSLCVALKRQRPWFRLSLFIFR